MKTVRTFSFNPSFSAISNLHLSSPVHITTLRPFRIKARAPSFKPSPSKEERVGRNRRRAGREGVEGQEDREEGAGIERGGGGREREEEGVGRVRERERGGKGQGEREEEAGKQRGGAGRQRGGGREREEEGAGSERRGSKEREMGRQTGRAMLKLVRDAVKMKSQSMDFWGLLLKSYQTVQ